MGHTEKSGCMSCNPKGPVPNNYIHYYPKPKYQIIGYLDPLGKSLSCMIYLNHYVTTGDHRVWFKENLGCEASKAVPGFTPSCGSSGPALTSTQDRIPSKVQGAHIKTLNTKH